MEGYQMDNKYYIADVDSNFTQESFDDYFTSESSFTPRISYSENKERLVIECYLPGFSSENLDVKVNKNLLSISSKTGSGKPFFYRPIELPDYVNPDNMQAHFKGSCIKFSIPK